MKSVGGFPHLFRHVNGKYYFRIAIPIDLQHIVGTLCFKKSLKTSDKALACQYCRILSNRAEWAFSGMRSLVKDNYGLMSNEDLKAAVRNHFEKCLLDGEMELYTATTAIRSDSIEQYGEEADPQNIRQEVARITQNSRNLLDHLREMQSTHCFDNRQSSVAQQLVEYYGLHVPKESGQFAEFCLMVLRAHVEAERIKLAHYSGNPAQGIISDPMFQECRNYFEVPHVDGATDWQKPYLEHKGHGLTLREVADQYVRSREIEGVSSKRLKDIVSFMNRLVEYIGPDTPLNDITKKTHGTEIKEFILRLPAFYQAGMGPTLRQIIHDGAEYDAIKPETGIRFWGIARAFFSWCVTERELMARNPLDGIRFKKPKGRDGRRYGLQPEQLQHLFTSPIYTARKKGDKALWERGEEGHVIRDGFFWLPLVALYTGFRESEILNLYPSDIRQDKGVLYIDCNVDTDGKSLKTDHSKRGLPVHPELLAMGFAEYCDDRKKRAKSGERLFGDSITIPDNNPSKNFTRRFSDYLFNIGMKTKDGSKYDNNVCFHTLRHNYISMVRRLRGVSTEILDDLTGHCEDKDEKGASSRGRYGAKHSPAELYEYVSQLKFDVDLSHLKIKP